MSNPSFRTFEDLDCWKACRDVRTHTSRIVKGFPADERYELVSHMKRTARSTTHNIAEGYVRFHYQESIQFCRHSRGSLFELLDQYITASDEGYITSDQTGEARDIIERATQLLNGYIRYLEKMKNAPSESSNQPINDSTP